MTEFTYNNPKNASTSYMPFELNCRYHPRIPYKKDLDLCLQSKTAEKLSSELQNLMAACQQNFYHAQEFQKQAPDKKIKLQSYAPGKKVWFHSKYFKT